MSTPVITAEPMLLWPPNNEMTPVDLAVSAPGTETVEIRIVDEYGTLSQTEYGTEAMVQLEVWRKGNDKEGRTDTITAVATGAFGQATSAPAAVSDPRDQR